MDVMETTLEQPTFERTTRTTAVAGIELKGLRKTYRTPTAAVEAVRDVDLVVESGETVALLGPNGAGKSTTLDLVLGLQVPDGGTVAIFGERPSEAVAGGRVGAMLQTGGLLRDLTVRELVTMMSALYPSPLDVGEALAVAGIEELAGRRTEQLSSGQTQRVRFALAVASDPELLVLDEPTVGMDVEARHAFWTTVRALARRGRTVLFATHYLEEAEQFADRAVLMARGGVVADGPTTEIKALVGTRTIRATLPDVPVARLVRLPGVARAERRGEAVVLVCSDSDTAIRAFLAEHPAARDLEIGGAGLEQAFLQLTGAQADDEPETAR
jgi:ABC-2 type transport system ATP-binding protein